MVAVDRPLELVNPVSAEIAPAPLEGCRFAYDDGRMCLDLQSFARGFCARHYQQLRRLGVFERQRTARHDEALANVNADRLDKAVDILERAAPLMARTAIKAAKVAADKGLHRAALDVLLHTRAIDPLPKDQHTHSHSPQPTFTVNIGVKLAGQSDSK